MNHYTYMIFYHTYIPILFYLIPLFLITGPFLPDLSLCIIAFFGLIFLFRNKNWFSLVRHPIILILIIFYIYALINSLFSDYVLNSLEHSLFYFRYIFFLLSIYFLYSKFKKIFVSRFLIISFISSIVLTIDLFIQYLFGQNLLGYVMDPNLKGMRFSGFFKDELIAGSYLSRLLPFVLILYFYLIKEKQVLFRIKILYLLFVCLIFSGIFLSGERIATFFSIIQISFFIIINLSEKRVIKYFILLIILASSIFAFTDNNMKKRIINVTIDSFKTKTDIDGLILFTPTHHAHYLTAWNMFIDKPIFGHGAKSFRLVCDNEKYIEIIKFEAVNNGNKFIEQINGCSTHPHNILLELLSENGIIGLLIFYILYLFIFHTFIQSLFLFYKHRDKSLERIIILFCSLSFLLQFFPFLPSGSFYHNWLSVLYYLPLSFIYMIKIDKKQINELK